MSFARASLSDLDAVHKILQDPLTGRKVMIPFTSKAFFAGTLQPTIIMEDDDDDDDNGSAQERVKVKLSKDTLVDMSRSEALELFEKRMQSFPEETREVKPMKIDKKSPATVATHSAAESPVGFFEIREEYDDTGNEIRAEAINVARELEFLEKGDETEVSALLRKPVEWNANGDISTNNTSSTDAMNALDNDDDNSKPVVTDMDFEKLSLRLEELARLEEETEAGKAINRKSAKTLQGSGWAKGFLNRPPPPPKRSTRIAADNKVAVRTIPNNSGKPRTTKHVKFGGTDIREIPRVGTSAGTPPTVPRPSPRQSISNAIFKDVVAERPVIQVREAAAPVNVPHPPAPTTERKLSRFAQQRLEQRQHGTNEATEVSRFAQDREQYENIIKK